MKILFGDTETTGVSEERNCIHQFAGIIDNLSPHDGELTHMDSMVVEMRPHENAIVEAEALAVSGLDVDAVMNRDVTFNMGMKRILAFMDRHVDRYNKSDKLWFVGYNGNFDKNMMYSGCKRIGFKYLGSLMFWPPIEVSSMAALMLGPDRHYMTNFKLASVAAQLDITEDKVRSEAEKIGIELGDDLYHDAMYDTLVTREMFKIVAAPYLIAHSATLHSRQVERAAVQG